MQNTQANDTATLQQTYTNRVQFTLGLNSKLSFAEQTQVFEALMRAINPVLESLADKLDDDDSFVEAFILDADNTPIYWSNTLLTKRPRRAFFLRQNNQGPGLINYNNCCKKTTVNTFLTPLVKNHHPDYNLYLNFFLSKIF